MTKQDQFGNGHSSKNHLTPRVNTKEAAALLGISVRTLEDWRSNGIGPKYVKVGQKIIRYEIYDLNSFVNEGRMSVTNDDLRREG